MMNQLISELKDNVPNDSIIEYLDLRPNIKSKLGIATAKDLCPVVSQENNFGPGAISRKTAEQHFHIDPYGIYWEDADMHAEPDKPISKAQLLGRIHAYLSNHD